MIPIHAIIHHLSTLTHLPKERRSLLIQRTRFYSVHFKQYNTDKNLVVLEFHLHNVGSTSHNMRCQNHYIMPRGGSLEVDFLGNLQIGSTNGRRSIH